MFVPTGPDEEALRQARLAVLGNRFQQQPPDSGQQPPERGQDRTAAKPKHSNPTSGDNNSELRKRNLKPNQTGSESVGKNTNSKPPDPGTSRTARSKPKTEEDLREARLAALENKAQVQPSGDIQEKPSEKLTKEGLDFKSEVEDSLEKASDSYEPLERSESNFAPSSTLPQTDSNSTHRPDQFELPPSEGEGKSLELSPSASEEDSDSMLRGSASIEGQVSTPRGGHSKSPTQRESPDVPKHPDLKGDELMLYVLSQIFNIKVVSFTI